MKKRPLTDNRFVSKWSEKILEHGFTAVPNLLLRHRADLGLTPTECLVIIAIDSFRWTNQYPWPSLEALSKRSGFSTRTVSRTVTNLERMRILKRIKRKGTTNCYDLSPLTDWLEGAAIHMSLQPRDKSSATTADKYPLEVLTTLSSKEYSNNNKNLKRKNKDIYDAELIPPEQ